MTDVPQYLSNISALSDSARAFRFSPLNRFGRGGAAGHATSGIVPQVIAWPHSADDNGDSYPAGLVGVRFRYRHERPTPSTDADNELVAVPAELPAGYSHRWLRDHNQGTRGRSSAGSNSTDFSISTSSFMPGAVSAQSQYLVRVDDGLYDVPRLALPALSAGAWLPYNQGTKALTCPNPSGISDLTWPGTTGETSLTSATGIWMSTPCAGFRYFRWAVHYNALEDFRVRIYCNSDGSQTYPPDTIIDEQWFPTAGPGVFYSSTVGPYDFPLGSPRFIGIDGAYRIPPATTWNPGGMSARIQMGARLDIPFPFLATGEGDLFAPGGIVPGTVPGY